MTDVYAKLDAFEASDKFEERAAAAVWADVTDRRGWRQEADQFDDEIKLEILDTWARLISSALLEKHPHG